VNSSTYWLIKDRSRIIGAVNIRHRLNPYLLEVGGHIGYGIRPSERRKGYATEILKQALAKARDPGISEALVTCDKDNIGSAKVIIKNGGVLESEVVSNGLEIQRYWIKAGGDMHE
jgi:predicted acetyltransferase